MVTRTSRILDANGAPIQVTDLEETQSSRLAYLHQNFQGHPARGLTPSKLAGILVAAEQGDLTSQCELYEDMEERDAHILCEMGKRRRALLTIPWDVAPPSNASSREKKSARALKELLQEIDGFEQLIHDITDAIGKGFSCLELEWQFVDGMWLPKAAHHRNQDWFQITRTSNAEEIRLRDHSFEGAALRPFGWITHAHKAKSGYLARAALFRVLTWPYLFKNYAVGDLAEFLEIVGIPLRIGKYPSNASEKDKVTLLRALASIGHNAAGIVPEGMALEFHDAAKGEADPFMAMIEWCEKTVSKAVLGGTLTSQADGKSSTNALGNVHEEVRMDLRDADARQVQATITRDLIYPIAALNGLADGLRRCPRFLFALQEPEDIKHFAENLPPLVKMGFRVDRQWAQEKVGIPEPEEDAELLGSNDETEAVPAVPKDAPTAAATAQPATDGDAVDIATDMLTRGTEAAMTVWVLTLSDAAAAHADFGAYEAHLVDVIGALSLAPMADEIAKAMTVAGLAGRASVADELQAEIGIAAASSVQTNAGVIYRGWEPAAEYFRQKLNLPTLRWDDLWQGQHARAFVVAGATRDALLKDLREAVRAAIEDGIAFETFRQRFEEIVARNKWTGWTGESTDAGRAWRARIIYKTNLRTAHAAGRYRQMTDPAVLAHMPYWQYRHNTLINPREEHKGWDGLVLRWDDPWWHTHYPPNGWGCNCDVRPLSERQLRKLGKTRPDQAPGPGDGDPPPEWAYNVGETAWGKPVADAIITAERGGKRIVLDPRGPASFNRPDEVPFDVPPMPLGPAIRDPDELRAAFRSAIGGDSAVFKDPAGDRINITSAILDHWLEDPTKRQGREQYLPLLRSTVEQPFEVWVGFVRNELTGKVEMRRRYVRGFDVGKDRVVGVVVDAVAGQWVSFNLFQGTASGARNLRQGYLVWGRP